MENSKVRSLVNHRLKAISPLVSSGIYTPSLRASVRNAGRSFLHLLHEFLTGLICPERVEKILDK